MKILHLNRLDVSGGAARAAYRLHRGLLENGNDSFMLVQDKRGDDKYILGPKNIIAKGWARTKPFIETLPLYIHKNYQKTPYHIQWMPSLIRRYWSIVKSDIVHLHWICGGFIQIEQLKKFNKHLIWTLHDMWPFTGGCHYAGKCVYFHDKCGRCPQLGSKCAYDVSRFTWWRKVRAWKKLSLTIVSPSQWLANQAKASSLFKDRPIEVIPNGLNIDCYKPFDQKVAREIFSFPMEKKLILFGAIKSISDKRKGFQFLKPALQLLSNSTNLKDTELVVFGASEPENPPELGFPVHYMGTLHDEISIALLYSAVDVFVAPSIQDNLPNTVMESLACGTPCVAFNIGGMPDMIEHLQNGYLVSPFDYEDLARGLKWVLDQKGTHLENHLRLKAREKVVKNFDIKLVVEKYIKLYKNILS